ncbi:WGR domain protein (plasmid) [Roseovarius sp. THAF8]|uniref:WGR domain-containing protein n=1 Tax=Roseovarius sp. THAF8 TaxID=2587846 RepID=UPI0012684DAD|nr:WGR domain-containing protein [Roseovarius sp. THAF8]QFT99828.1 WGR domain protein [Roseovarius sp. THAF8]
MIPTNIDLKRIDPSLNMRRFYRMCLQPDLFGGVDLVREWGRIGRGGQVLIERHSGEAAAITSMQSLEASKLKRGYETAAL